MLRSAGQSVEAGELDDACGQLVDALDRTDGQFPPPDFVAGFGASELYDMILTLRWELMCGVVSLEPGAAAIVEGPGGTSRGAGRHGRRHRTLPFPATAQTDSANARRHA